MDIHPPSVHFILTKDLLWSPFFSLQKKKKMQCIILYGDPTPAGYTASSQIEVEIHSYML